VPRVWGLHCTGLQRPVEQKELVLCVRDRFAHVMRANCNISAVLQLMCCGLAVQYIGKLATLLCKRHKSSKAEVITKLGASSRSSTSCTVSAGQQQLVPSPKLPTCNQSDRHLGDASTATTVLPITVKVLCDSEGHPKTCCYTVQAAPATPPADSPACRPAAPPAAPPRPAAAPAAPRAAACPADGPRKRCRVASCCARSTGL
jgi:hypothetical protein